MTLEEVAREFLRRWERGERYSHIRRGAWTPNANVEIRQTVDRASAIVLRVKLPEGSAKDSVLVSWHMDLWKDDTVLVVYWCPSVEDAFADDWSFE